MATGLESVVSFQTKYKDEVHCMRFSGMHLSNLWSSGSLPAASRHLTSHASTQAGFLGVLCIIDFGGGGGVASWRLYPRKTGLYVHSRSLSYAIAYSRDVLGKAYLKLE